MPAAEVVSTNSLCYRMVERVRLLLNEPETDARWSDNYLLRELVQPALTQVMSRLSLGQDNPIILRMTISVTAGQEYYVLPPGVREVVRLGAADTYGNPRLDWVPGGENSAIGTGWQLVGNSIRFTPIPQRAQDWTLWYIPSGDFIPHYSTAGVQDSAQGTKTLTLATTPTLGYLDKRTNGYAGGLLRLMGINGYGGPIQEHMILSSSYSSGSWVITLATPYNPSVIDVSGLRYEVVPAGYPLLWKAVAEYAAIDLAVPRDMTEKQMRHLYLARDTTMKSLQDDLSNLQGRTGKAFHNETLDNHDRTIGGLLDGTY